MSEGIDAYLQQYEEYQGDLIRTQLDLAMGGSPGQGRRTNGFGCGWIALPSCCTAGLWGKR
jgi:hypothetical protein